MRIRKVVLNVIVSASPRTSGPLAPDLSMVRNLSRTVWREKVDGLLGTGMKRRGFSGKMVVEFVLRMPYLSQLRYL